MPGLICSICSHGQFAAIDAALASGARLVPTAAQFGVSKSALGRHKNACLAPRLAAAAMAVANRTPAREAREALASGGSVSLAEIGTAQGLTRKIAATLERLERAAEQAADRSQFASLAAVSAQLLRGIESAAKLHGLYADAGTPGSGGTAFQINIQVNAVTRGAQRHGRGSSSPTLRGADDDEPNGEAQRGLKIVLAAPSLPVPDFELGPLPPHVEALKAEYALCGADWAKL